MHYFLISLLAVCPRFLCSCFKYIVVTARSSGILIGKQKLGVTFNSDKLGGIELMINKLHGLSPSGGLVSPSGGFA